MGQLIGGCLGTQIEGYTTEQIRNVSARSTDISASETYNDDITYEIAYLDDSSKKAMTSRLPTLLQMAGADLRRIFR